jgi:hypothetical protein
MAHGSRPSQQRPKPKSAGAPHRSERKFDLSDLAWQPATDDEREQERRRAHWYTFWKQISASEAHELLEQILSLRERRLRDEHAGIPEETGALALAARLAEGTVGWAAGRMLMLFLQHAPTEPERIRMLVSEALKLPLPLMPNTPRFELAAALDRLWFGEVRKILRPETPNRRGKAWMGRTKIQLEFLCWIEFKTSSRQLRIGQARTQVGWVCGDLSPQAIQKWKSAVKVRPYSSSFVENEIAKARLAGRATLEPATKSDPVIDIRVRELSNLNIEKLGQRYRQASEPRTGAKPKARQLNS